jgi:ribokinase
VARAAGPIPRPMALPAPRLSRPAPLRYGAQMRHRPRVTVLGSLNMDISVTVPRLPAPGATVLGSAARFTPGGKGANQAVAAARLGAAVRMAGCVGDDDFGRQLLAALRAEKVETENVRVTESAPTGLAMISVDQAGENIITVAPGANHETGPAEVRAALAEPQNVLVVCAEIRAEVIVAALARHRVSILNLAPAPADAAAVVAGARPDWLVVNETEAGAVLGRPVSGLAEAAQAAVALVDAGVRHAVVTAGAHGAALADGPGPAETVQAFRVEAVDTVGAGDTFVGALAVALAAGVPAAEAVRAAAAAGATAATRPGAQAGMPRPEDIRAMTGLTWPVR